MKNKNGITLIALIITIIVMLILAGVSIALLTGENGILTQAEEAKNKTEIAKIEEELQIAFMEKEINRYANSNSNMEEKLKDIFEKGYGEGKIEVNKSGKNYKVKVKNAKTVYKVRYDGTMQQYEEMDPTDIYGKLDEDGTLYLRATQLDGYEKYVNSYSITPDYSSLDILKVIVEEPIAPVTMEGIFYNSKNLEFIENIQYLHTENVTNMKQAFWHCEKIKNLDVSNFDTSKVINMESMFDCCYELENLDVTGFDTTNVKTTKLMFIGCRSLEKLDVGYFCTEKVENMAGMFRDCYKLKQLDVSKFDTSKVKDMSWMFYACSSINMFDINNFNTSNVTNMSNMFWGCKAINELDVSNFDTGNVINMNAMFSNCSNLKIIDLRNKFRINDETDYNNIFYGISNKIEKIKARQDTVDKLKVLYPNLTDSNFEIVN